MGIKILNSHIFFKLALFQNACMVYKHMLLLLHSIFMLSVVKMLLKGEVRGHVLKSHGNYIVQQLIMENHGKIMELCFGISVGTLIIQDRCSRLVVKILFPCPLGSSIQS